MGFFLKKLVGALLMPVPVVLILGLSGMVLLRRGRRARAGRVLVTGSLVLLVLASFGPLAMELVRPLEDAYPAFPGDSVAYVVVLGGGHVSDPELPPSSLLNGPTLYRLVEGVRIATAQPWATLVLSGYGGADSVSNAEAYRRVAVALGVSPDRIVTEARPRDTRQEARYIAPLVGDAPFALVTSAMHMPRAVAHFRARGVDPVPAPTGHLRKENQAFGLEYFIPASWGLFLTRQAWYEYLGRAWGRVTGQFDDG